MSSKETLLRAEFETWYVKHCEEHGFNVTMDDIESKRGEEGNYEDYSYLCGAWHGFCGAEKWSRWYE